ncbi:hypothetical protein [Thalassotalea sp. ND16A]|uniref:hypothetical protein n=1 Tax=Thalassotalea sp. ND16A TaxID=1535422 RepID=UPI00051D0365|nr:hypothetical protein [Thalassotalea sp. ND16A]KGK00673.1 hypothetical protein ND16A_3433 [Thalassotalea sp. ND16A]
MNKLLVIISTAALVTLAAPTLVNAYDTFKHEQFLTKSVKNNKDALADSKKALNECIIQEDLFSDVMLCELEYKDYNSNKSTLEYIQNKLDNLKYFKKWV